MEFESFDETMAEIAIGLNSEPEHDLNYLKEQIVTHKDHPQAKEIGRACGRLMWQIMPDDMKTDLESVIANHEKGTQAILDEALFCMKQGNPVKSLKLIEPLIQKLDELTESGWSQDDTESAYFNFESPIEEAIWRAHSNEIREARPAIEPFCRAYFLYGSALYEVNRHREAIAALSKAIRWNPANPHLRFELGENFKKLGDMRSYGQVLEEIHPLIANASDMARYHRAKGFLFVEQDSYKVAAAHLVFSLLFENSPMALSEIMYIKMEHGEDYTDMTPESAVAILEHAGEVFGINGKTAGVLSSLIGLALDHGDLATATTAAINLYELTGDEEIEDLARGLLAMAEGECPE